MDIEMRTLVQTALSTYMQLSDCINASKQSNYGQHAKVAYTCLSTDVDSLRMKLEDITPKNSNEAMIKRLASGVLHVVNHDDSCSKMMRDARYDVIMLNKLSGRGNFGQAKVHSAISH